MKHKGLFITLTIFLSLVMLASGTAARMASYDSVHNHLETAQIADGSVSIIEVFTPEPEWEPGQTITKQAAVTNAGSVDVLVRVSFEEVARMLSAAPSSSESAAAGTAIPQLFDAAQYESAPWTDLSGFSDVTDLPDDIAVKMNKTIIYPGTPEERISYAFAIYSPITSGVYAGKYQRVTATFDIDGDTLEISDLLYWQYNGWTTTEAAWAQFSNPQTAAAPTPPAADDIGHPISDTNQKIQINYSDHISAVSTAPITGTWWYNPEDGFFYYIGSVAPGTVTPNLIESLVLAADADESYTGMKLDLIVNMEAIQNTSAAIAAANGWNLNGNTALLEALAPFCKQ